MVGAMPRLASFVMNAVGSDFKIQVGLACLPYHSCLHSKTACFLDEQVLECARSSGGWQN
jgi:hypothetical protein